MDFIVDASVAMGWLLKSQETPLTVAAEEALTSGNGWIPCHFGIEVGRSLRGLERHGLVTPDVVDRSFARLHDLPLQQDPEPALDTLPTTVKLARRHALRIADAVYLELALRLRLPLATRDAAFARAAETAGVVLFKN